MKCPHCLDSFFPSFKEQYIESYYSRDWITDHDTHWRVHSALCPSCRHAVIYLERINAKDTGQVLETHLMNPKGVARAPLSPVVPEKYAADYREACVVLPDSTKASAALSRRCLQHLLSDEAGVKGNLFEQIQQVVDSKNLPSYLSGAVDAVRKIGNFAVHPTKSKSTGEIVDVEPGEAEWLPDTLEGLFDFYFVQPAVLKAKQDALDKKLADARKRPVKNP